MQRVVRLLVFNELTDVVRSTDFVKSIVSDN